MNTLIVLIGLPGSGKTTWTNERYNPTQRLSLDDLRGQLTDDEGDQSATADAVTLRRLILAERCRRHLDTVVDSTNVLADHRRELLMHARIWRMLAVAVVFDTPFSDCRLRRPDPFPGDVLERMFWQMRESVPAAGPVPGFDVTRRIGPGIDLLLHDTDHTSRGRFTGEAWTK